MVHGLLNLLTYLARHLICLHLPTIVNLFRPISFKLLPYFPHSFNVPLLLRLIAVFAEHEYKFL